MENYAMLKLTINSYPALPSYLPVHSFSPQPPENMQHMQNVPIHEYSISEFDFS